MPVPVPLPRWRWKTASIACWNTPMPTRRSSTAGRTNSIVRNALKTLYLFLIPAFLLVLVFNYVPMVGLIMAFQNYQANLGWFGSEFVGLTHFVEFLQDPTFWTVLKNTLVISVSLMIFHSPLPFCWPFVLTIFPVRDSSGRCKPFRICRILSPG